MTTYWRILNLAAAVVLGLGWCSAASAQAKSVADTLPIVMLSDLHFDPLHDPAKVARLAAAPVAQWQKILSEPASARQAEAFAETQLRCGAKGTDTDEALLDASLHAARESSANARFVTVSGDLVVHGFDCRYRHVLHTDEGYAAFVEKTTNYVIERVEGEFARVPVYVALGNNDSGCGDYRIDLHDRYLKATSAATMAGLRGASAEELQRARADYETGGYFAVSMPALPNTRLLVLDDLFLSRRYTTCSGKKDEAASASVLRWLSDELSASAKKNEKVWLMSHIPPGIDVYGTLAKFRNVCGGTDPEMFLASDALGSLLAKYPETIRLAIFGHTHSDEFRALNGVPVKLIGSVSPVHGNAPSYTIGQVEPHTAVLRDYSVFVAPDKTGAGVWAREYRFDETFSAESFSGPALQKTVNAFRSDPDAAAPASKAYIRDFYPGALSPLSLVWPQAACAMQEFTAAGYRGCVCGAAKPGTR
jgi:sphingomyelin phosphodiesterase acid-like 3